MRCFEKGFTLIELLFTVVIIAVGLVGIMAMFENATRGAMQADLNVIAANLAHEKLEQIVLDKWRDGYPSLGAGSYPNENFSSDFSVYTRNTAITEVASSDFTTSEPGSGYKRVDVTVRWGPDASQRVTIPTVLSDY